MSSRVPGELFIVYASLIPVEHIPLLHVCPGGIALRIVVPGSPVACTKCRWADIIDARGLELKRFSRDHLGFLSIAKPRILVADGPEPLASSWPGIIELPSLVKEASKSSLEYSVVATMGFTDTGRLEEAHSAGYQGVLFEYLLHVERLRGVADTVKVLEKAYDLFDAVEIIVPLGDPRTTRLTVHSLAEKYPEAAIHVVGLNGEDWDTVYSIAREVRGKKSVNVYPHPDESYTLSDTVCTRCGTVLVERRPWGVRVYGGQTTGGRLVCPKCGYTGRILGCTSRQHSVLHREIVVY